MEKQKIIEAYYNGYLTREECAQLLGTDDHRLYQLLIHTQKSSGKSLSFLRRL